MTAKEYLNQAFRLDQRINSKIEQVSVLNDLATKCTSTITGMPHSASPNNSSMSQTIDKIIDLQNEINSDIDKLVNLKREITQVIKEVENIEYQIVLEKRYLCFLSWEQIAVDLNYGLRHIHKLHAWALSEVKIPDK